MPLANAVIVAPSPPALSRRSKCTGKITISIGMYTADVNIKIIVKLNNARSACSARNPAMVACQKFSLGKFCSWVSDVASAIRINITLTDATKNRKLVANNASTGPTNLINVAPIAGPTAQPTAKKPSCRLLADSRLIDAALAALGINDLRAVNPAGSNTAPKTAIRTTQIYVNSLTRSTSTNSSTDIAESTSA